MIKLKLLVLSVDYSLQMRPIQMICSHHLQSLTQMRPHLQRFWPGAQPEIIPTLSVNHTNTSCALRL